jgi:hypothetical protein
MRRQIRLAVITGLVASCALLSSLGLIALRGGGRVAAGPVTLLEVAAGYDRRAVQDLDSPHPSAATLADADAASRAAIADYPYDTHAWEMLAFVDRQEHGRLTPPGVAALQKSYDLIGIDPADGHWRIAFALENSQAIPRGLRASVREEVSARWTYWEDRNRIIDLQPKLENPAGRLSLALWINQLQSTAAK